MTKPAALSIAELLDRCASFSEGFSQSGLCKGAEHRVGSRVSKQMLICLVALSSSQ